MNLPARAVPALSPSPLENIAGAIWKGLGAPMRPYVASSGAGSQAKAAINDLAIALPPLVAAMDTQTGASVLQTLNYMRGMSSSGSLAGVHNAALVIARVTGRMGATATRVNKDLGIILSQVNPSAAPPRTNRATTAKTSAQIAQDIASAVSAASQGR